MFKSAKKMILKMKNYITKSIVEFAKLLAFRYTKIFAPFYLYNVEPIQLALLINEIERLKNISGNIVEIGVASGITTRFLCEHISCEHIENTLTLYAVDTFTSFTKSDLDYEISNRGKSLFELKGFGYNDYNIWVKNFSKYPFVKAIKADCSVLDYATIAPIKLVFLDVDLYLPTKNTLPKLYQSLVKGGVIVVDDIAANTTYDGAYQAFMEFCDARKITPKLIGNKCGVIYKQ